MVKVIKNFEKVRYGGSENVVYRPTTKVNSGCYKLQWEIKCNSQKEVIEKLRQWYPNEYYVSFNTNINHVLEDHGSIPHSVLVISSGANTSYLTFTLKQRKKSNPSSPKKKKHYYCDCWRCERPNLKKYISQQDTKRLDNNT